MTGSSTNPKKLIFEKDLNYMIDCVKVQSHLFVGWLDISILMKTKSSAFDFWLRLTTLGLSIFDFQPAMDKLIEGSRYVEEENQFVIKEEAKRYDITKRKLPKAINSVNVD